MHLSDEIEGTQVFGLVMAGVITLVLLAAFVAVLWMNTPHA
jgi:hypothetical protein